MTGQVAVGVKGREPDTGDCTELQEPVLRCQGRSTSGQNREARVPMRITGADRPVRALKVCNGTGAKGSGQAVAFTETTGNRMNSTNATNKPFNIEKRLVYEAYKAVKSNKGAAGVDKQTIDEFEKALSGNLYKIWNRMSSGSYFPHRCSPSPFRRRLEANGF